ncbi:MAG: SAM-dependent methyltransferase, partial [Chloroflexus sp.]|nr:SAM-dependent methyltransferase [Chloroflexus sp.]
MQVEIATTTRLTSSLDVERVTKRFYEEFKQQRETFQAWVRGIPEERDRRWYASVILHRLLFASFLQANGFLNNNPDYLRERLVWSKTHLGPDRYYRDVLRLLFWQGFACEPARRNPRVTQILGSIPYL